MNKQNEDKSVYKEMLKQPKAKVDTHNLASGNAEKQYDVYFKYGSKIVQTKKVLYNTLLTEYPLLTREGYRFDGWYSDEKLECKVNAVIVKDDLVLYAKMIKNAYKKKGKYVYMGHYPQSSVGDPSLVKEIAQHGVINSLGYYEYNGKEYAKSSGYDGYLFDPCIQDWDPYVEIIDYYFVIEPIMWRILSDEENEYLLLSEHTLERRDFYTPNKEEKYRIINGERIYNNDYAHSHIRKWLNDDFYNYAFSEEEKEQIKLTLVDNSELVRKSAINTPFYQNTYDKVFLLSYQDANNPDYGFICREPLSRKRFFNPTSYYKIKNSSIHWDNEKEYSSDWWLRTTTDDDTESVNVISFLGSNGSDLKTDVNAAVRPVIRIYK